MSFKFLRISLALVALAIGTSAIRGHTTPPAYASPFQSVSNGLRATGQGLTLGDRRDFKLINASASVTIVHVYVSAAVIDDWEEDVLGADVLDPGDFVTIHFNGFDGSGKQCLYDIRVDGDKAERGYLYGIDLCSIDTVTFS